MKYSEKDFSEEIYNRAMDIYIDSLFNGKTKDLPKEEKEELAEPASCPIATQDIKTNLANRQTAVDDANYGPANPNEPNDDYWKAKADEFQGDVATAKKMLCGNCAAFDQRSKVLGCIKKGIGEDANEVAIGGDLGYCEIFDFKCAAKRTCDAWIVGGPITDKKEELARPVSQTPAPPKERIKGSKENPEGTASTRSKAGDIEISAENEEALKNKIAEFKDKHPSRKAPTLGALKKVFRRGAGAFSTSFRPTITGGKPNSRNAWAMARVNKFLKMAGGGEVKDSYRKADGDLLEERFDCGTGAGGFKEGNTCAGGGGSGVAVSDITTTKTSSKIDAQYEQTIQKGDSKKAEKIIESEATKNGFSEVYHISKSDKPFTEFLPRVKTDSALWENHAWNDFKEKHPEEWKKEWLKPGGTGKLPSWFKPKEPEPEFIYVSPTRQDAEKLGKFNEFKGREPQKFYAYLGKTYETDKYIRDLKPSDIPKGYDSVSGWMPNANNNRTKVREIVILRPENIKSSKAVEKDGSGKTIPPSKRFDRTTKDIRGAK
jgi:hypothetical protein